ncbi:hypothetical protein COD05_14530 [Bacillus cereus]|uniref:hypothetical protein n=1 Tax=Bacillus sp. AW TaxID=2293329 RepID=UPI000BF7A3DF|nr:hypothetical protein COJ53_01955 [Bacillus cereus]PFQ82342.1 hypothetical protein COK28_29005 [Bacillus cereus]PGP33787.1 hypothetical protein CN989_24545 [Bacillus cereus]PGT07834.1 hypothetical protein COD05_14530 [Bacillus cereus]RFB74669.1 hypothetical protein DZB94_11720 [Bacillus sp. AW]
MNQFSFFEDIDEKEMRRLVVKELKNYKTLCVRMKNQEDQEKQRKESVYKLVRLYLEKLVKQGEIKEVARSRSSVERDKVFGVY